MGLADFAAGWALGAKTGNRGFDEVLGTAREIVRSKEFADFASAIRSHAAYALRELGDLVDSEQAPAVAEDLVEVVRSLIKRRDYFK